MEATFSTLTDLERVEALNNIYKKGLSTPKEDLAFSSDKLVYLKPFIARLQGQNGVDQDLSTRLMVRQIVDELLRDILEEVEAASSRLTVAVDRLINEYGLSALVCSVDEEYYLTSKVA